MAERRCSYYFNTEAAITVLNNSCYRYKELSFFCAFIKIYLGNVKFEKLTANKFEGIFTSLRQVANLLQNERQISPLLSRLQSSHLL